MHIVELFLNVKSNECVIRIVIKKVDIDVDCVVLGGFEAAAEPEHFTLV
jgi:hypothetical protein